MIDIDWDRAGADLDAFGCAVLPALLDADQCARMRPVNGTRGIYRVNMRHGAT